MSQPFNRDVAVLAKKIHELSILSPEALEARKWEAVVLVIAAFSSATPVGHRQGQRRQGGALG